MELTLFNYNIKLKLINGKVELMSIYYKMELTY